MAILQTTFKNAQDIDNFFIEKTGSSFVEYFNNKHAGQGSFAKNNGKASVPTINNNGKANWNKIWNSINDLFGKEEINIAEFLSINTAMQMETGSSYSSHAERVGRSGAPGLAYAFTPIKGIKSSYNKGEKATELGNKSAFKLFNDNDFIKAHGHKPFGNILKNTTDNRWDTDQFPYGFSGADASKETSTKGSNSGFLSEADFMKYRGRGFIQTTGRGNYIKIIKFVKSYKGNQSTVLKFKGKFNKISSNNKIATEMSNSEWDELFNKSDLVIPNAAVDIHAQSTSKKNGGPSRSPYNQIDVSVSEDDVLKTKGPVWWVGRRINGAIKYANALLARVVQIIDDLNEKDPNAVAADDQTEQTTGATGDPAADKLFNEDTSDTANENTDFNSADLPKTPGIENFFLADTTKLKLSPISFSDSDINTQRKKENAKFIGYNPLLAFSGIEIQTEFVKSLVLRSNQLLPTLRAVFIDNNNLISDKAFPLDDTNVQVFINSKTKSMRHIFMEFKLVKFNKNKDIITIDCIANVNRFFLRKFEAYNMSSFDTLKEFSKRSGVGFSSNIRNTEDKMAWINPGTTGKEFIEDVIDNSFNNDESFMWCYMDLYYNLNYIDIEKALQQDVQTQGGVLDLGVQNIDQVSVDKSETEKVVPLVLTSDVSSSSSNYYFDSWKVMNNASSISLKNGYLNRIKYYDTQNIDFNIFEIDSLTTDDDNKIIMKSKPQDNDYFREHVVSNYNGKFDIDNAHKNYLYAATQNKQNLAEIQKIGIIISLPNPNYNLYRFQKINIVISNQSVTPTAEMINQRLKGEWLIIDIKYTFVNNVYRQSVTLIKRELELSEEELKKEDTIAKPAPAPDPAVPEAASNETDPAEDIPPPEPEVVEEEVKTEDEITFDFDKTFTSAAEIDAYFSQFDSDGFVDWFNDNAPLNTRSNSTDKELLNKDIWLKVWNSIEVIFAKEEVNMAEFLSLNSVLYLSNNYKSSNGTAIVQDGTVFITNNFSVNYEENNFSSGVNPFDNLASNSDYNKAHKHLKFGELLSDEDFDNTLIEDYFLEQSNSFHPKGKFPEGWSGIEDETNRFLQERGKKTFLAQSDFWKIRGRGMLITLGRGYYYDLVRFVLNYAGDNMKISTIKDKWLSYVTIKKKSGKGGESIKQLVKASADDIPKNVTRIVVHISNDKDWNSLFEEVEFQIVALGTRLNGSSSVGNRSAESIHHIDVAGKSEDKIETAMLNLAKSVVNIEKLKDKHLPLIKAQVSLLQGKSGGSRRP